MLCKDIIQSITLLSLLQLVFSERSANNVYSYLCPHSPSMRMIDIGAAAFTLFRIPVSNKMCKSKAAAVAGFSIDRRSTTATTSTTSWGNHFNNNVNHVNTMPMIGKRMNMNTERHLFSFNLNDMMRGVDDKAEVKLKSDVKGKNEDNISDKASSSIGNSWETMMTKYKKSGKKNDNEGIATSINTSNEKNPGPSFSLSSLINVEALLLASEQVEIDTSQDEAATRTNLLRDVMKRESISSTSSSSTTTTTTTAVTDDDSNHNSIKEMKSNTSIEKSVNIKNAETQLSWETLSKTFQQNIKDLVESPTTFTPSFEFSMAAEVALKEATQSLEEFVNDATSTFTSEKYVQTLIASTSRNLSVDQNAEVLKDIMDRVVVAAETLARDQGLDVSDAAMQARAMTKQSAEFVHAANGVLVAGYVRDDRRSQLMKENNQDLLEIWNIPVSDEVIAKPLFDNYKSAQAIANEDVRSVIEKGAEMAVLAGAIYQDTLEQSHEIGHSIVANGTTADVAWMVTDSIAYEQDFKRDEDTADKTPMMIRTITIRGYDASDERVDREKLLFNICDAAPVPLGDGSSNINLHKGLFQVSKEIYKDILPYIDMAGPNHKVVLNGHSIGGSIANLLLLQLTNDRGADYVNEKVQRVFTFGSPPIANLVDQTKLILNDSHECSILKSLNLRSDIVYGYIQPWDPIVRMFSRIDPLYPLIGDLGEDGYSLYASGPPRTLRPILRALLESWEEWPTFRDSYRYVLNNEYLSTGVQHIFMPDIGRYLTDRLISVNIATFPIEDMIRISSKDLCSALEEAFPLDTFSISLVPTAIRSFIHHFFPAYTDFAEYAEKNRNDIDNNFM